MPVTQWVVTQAVTVYFIGAGPGAADLITVRGQRLLSRCPVCLYAGSIMPDDLLALCPPDAKVIDTGPLTLEQIVAELADADAAGLDVARLHSGDPSIYSALAEQCRRLDALGVSYEIVPGVPAFAAAAAALGRELTVPGVAQTVTLTRVATLSTAMPPARTCARCRRPAPPWCCTWPPRRSTRSCRSCSPVGIAPKRPVRWWHSRAGRRRRCSGARSATSPSGCTRPRTHPHRRHRRRRRPGRRGLHRQLPVLGGPAPGKPALSVSPSAARRHRRGAGTGAGGCIRDVEVISSLAGRVPDPALPVGEVRIGGFGGVEGGAVAGGRARSTPSSTPPIRSRPRSPRTRRGRAASWACRTVVLARPAWPHGGAIVVGSDAAGRESRCGNGYSRVFLTTGRSRARRPSPVVDAWFLIRAVTPPDAEVLPLRHQLLLSRGPYRYDDELNLLREHRIDALVTKNSGGDMTRAKLDAADALGVPVVMVGRPACPTACARCRPSPRPRPGSERF